MMIHLEVKRLIDVVFSLMLFTVLLPIFLIISVLLYLVMGPPVLYKQKRPGYKQRPFTILKFRTMTELRDSEGNYLPDHLRLTTVGKFIRIHSLDELPSLINVIKGDMSLVGPRPLLMKYLERYSTEQMRRHEVKPGITGWAQVNGRNAITWEEKFNLDLWYVDNYSFWLDLKILVLTVKSVLKRTGINQSEETTMEEFGG